MHIVARTRKINVFRPDPVGVAPVGVAPGKEVWLQRLGRHHSASPVVAEGNVYFLDDEGKCWIVKAQDTYELVGVNELGTEVRGSPAISRGQIFIRGSQALYCIGKK